MFLYRNILGALHLGHLQSSSILHSERRLIGVMGLSFGYVATILGQACAVSHSYSLLVPQPPHCPSVHSAHSSDSLMWASLWGPSASSRLPASNSLASLDTSSGPPLLISSPAPFPPHLYPGSKPQSSRHLICGLSTGLKNKETFRRPHFHLKSLPLSFLKVMKVNFLTNTQCPHLLIY